MRKDPQKVKDLITEALDLAPIMISYKVKFAFDPTLVSEVQFKCPFHGKDNKPSARLYNETKSCYCWVCQKSWDIVSFIAEMEQMSFYKALEYIVNRYHIDTSSIPDTPEFQTPTSVVSDKNVRFLWTRNNLMELRKKISFEKYRALYAAYSMIQYADHRGLDVIESLNKMRDKIECLKKQPS